MFGRASLSPLQLRKQALLLESHLNRAALQGQVQDLRASTQWVGEAAAACRKLSPWLLLLAPVAGILTVRSLGRPRSVIGRLVSVLKWVQPLYALWRGFRAGQK